MEVKTSTYLQNLSDPIMVKKDGAPCTQTRPGFSFIVGSRKGLPSKWDDAEKWLINGNESPANFMVKQCGINGNVNKEGEAKVLKTTSVFQEPKIVSLDHDVLLKDKFTNEVVQEVKNRDTGTEMTPTGSSTVSRCPTPIKSLSPPRHNTPENRMSLPGLMGRGSTQLECDLANKLQPWTPVDGIEFKWRSMEEEEEEISKSLRHFEMSNEFVENISGPRPSAWEEKDMLEPCLRYQIKEAKIQAWVNLQKAKAEAQSKKLEVKIQKMRSKHEEKMMKKMTIVRRKADELRAAAQLDHAEMVARSSKTSGNHPSVQFSGHHSSCGCLIRNR